jgi:hypothetical protein
MILRELVLAGANINTINTITGASPLIAAVQAQKLAAAREILVLGGDRQLRDSSGRTAADYAENTAAAVLFPRSAGVAGLVPSPAPVATVAPLGQAQSTVHDAPSTETTDARPVASVPPSKSTTESGSSLSDAVAALELRSEGRACAAVPAPPPALPGPPTFDVFLSYAWAHQPACRRIRDALRARGLTVWWDEERMAGDIASAMAEGITNARVVLLCVSKAYQDSVNCRSEATYARQKRAKIVVANVQVR